MTVIFSSLFHSLRRRRGRSYGQAGLGCSANLYDLYMRQPGAALPYVSEVSYCPYQKRLELARWNEANAIIGLKGVIRWLGLCKLIIEIHDLTETPAWLIYPVHSQWQVDEFDEPAIAPCPSAWRCR